MSWHSYIAFRKVYWKYWSQNAFGKILYYDRTGIFKYSIGIRYILEKCIPI